MDFIKMVATFDTILNICSLIIDRKYIIVKFVDFY